MNVMLEDWNPIATAPKDGTEIELLIRHDNFKRAITEEEKMMWCDAVKGKWIDFNGGGWTWEGMCGSPCGWRHLKSSNMELTRFAEGESGVTK